MNLLKTTAVAGLLAATGAASAVEVTGNVALTTDYIWRGLSQADNGPAVQGGFDAAFDGGLYAGVWGSNVDFGGPESMELDLYAGWAGEYEGVGIDVGLINYQYPSSNDGTNFTEFYAGVSFGPVSLTQSIGLDLGDENFGDTNFGNYTDLSADLGSYSNVAFSAHAGFYDVKEGGDDYYDWKLAASTTLLSVDWELAYSDTDDSGADDEAFVLTVSKSL